MCNERLRNYVYCMSRVLWTHLEHSYLISIYIVVHCTYIRQSVIIKNCSSFKCCLCAVRAVRFNHSAVPEDGDLTTGYGPSIWLCLRATIAAYAAQKDGDLAGEDFREHTATKE